MQGFSFRSSDAPSVPQGDDQVRYDGRSFVVDEIASVEASTIRVTVKGAVVDKMKKARLCGHPGFHHPSRSSLVSEIVGSLSSEQRRGACRSKVERVCLWGVGTPVGIYPAHSCEVVRAKFRQFFGAGRKSI